MTTQHDELAGQVPLYEQLASVPKEARLVIDQGPHSTRFIPVGRMCHEAAALLAADAQAGGDVVYFCDYGHEGWGKIDASAVEQHRSLGMTVEKYYPHPQPQAVAQGWNGCCPGECRECEATEICLQASQCMRNDGPLPAAPAAAQVEREIEQLIRERDHRDEIIDRLCDAVLGEDRHEWSSAYGFDDAVADVEERINQLHQPSVDRAWTRFEQAHSQPAAQVAQPLTRSERAEWWAVAMNAAASLEDAASCLRDPDAKKSAQGACGHVRQKCNQMWEAAYGIGKYQG